MSIHIKEYLSLMAVIGIIKTFSGNKKLDDAIKIISFFAMMSMVVFPLAATVISGDFMKSISISDNEVSYDNNKYMNYFAQSMSREAILLQINEIEEGFKAEFTLRGVKVLDCKAKYDGAFGVTLRTDKAIDARVTERLKDKYGVDKVNIRLVDTHD